MIQIHSKLNPSKVLHIIHKRYEFEGEVSRNDIVDGDQYIQLSTLSMNKGKTFRPHRHIWKQGPETCIAQESWVIISGKVRVYLYDTDDSLLYKADLSHGDASITLEGGHTYEILEDNTYVYEYKTGPYQGQELDKVFIDDTRD